MATVTTAIMVDDIDGSKADETVFFAVDGSQYSIDLSETNAAELRKALHDFVMAGRRIPADRSAARRRGQGPNPRVGAGGPPTRTTKSREESAAVRVWAREAGLTVSDKGRISAEVLAQYHDSRSRTSAAAGQTGDQIDGGGQDDRTEEIGQ